MMLNGGGNKQVKGNIPAMGAIAVPWQGFGESQVSPPETEMA